MAYADNIIITYTHTSTSTAKKYIQPYLYTKKIAWTKHNNLTLNPDKVTCTLFTPCPAESYSNLDLTINNKAITHGNTPKGSGSYLRPKTNMQHTHPQHLSTITQTSTNNKITHRNMME